jgi:hypothetical protein
MLNPVLSGKVRAFLRWRGKQKDQTLMGGFIGFLQALSTPAIAVAGATIAYQQKRLANIRLRNDLFDRRFKIYEAARTYLVGATRNQRLPVEDMFAFSRDTADAPFFFSQEIVNYLEEIGRQIGDMRVQAALIDEGRQAAIARAHALQQWCVDQIMHRKLLLKFKPEMELRPAPFRFPRFKSYADFRVWLFRLLRFA